MEQKKFRDSNLELFRIITMLLIVAHHYVVNSGLLDAGGVVYISPTSAKSIFLLLLGAWGKTGINCFVLITGYFMCKSNITAKKFVKLFCQIMFYKITISAIFWITGYEKFTLKGFLAAILPITSIGTDFESMFILFFLFIPFLNILIRNLDEKMHLRLLLLCGFTYIIFGTLHKATMNYITWFMVLYLIAAFIRLYPKKIYGKTAFWGIMTATSLLVSAASVVAIAALYNKLNGLSAYSFVQDSNTILAVITGISAFMFFKNLKIKYNPFINTVASATFGVLLIHAGTDAMRRFLWIELLDNVEIFHTDLVYIHAILSVLAIYAVCTAIDLLRIKFLEKPFLKQWEKIQPEFSKIIEKTDKKLFGGE